MDEAARLFVAVYPPAVVADRLEAELLEAELLEAWPPSSPSPSPSPSSSSASAFRLTPRHQWHVTLRFLGQSTVAATVAALATLAAGPAEARIGPSPQVLGGGVLCLPVAGLDDLAAAVAASIAASTASSSAPPPSEARPFRAHLTLARRRGRPPRRDRAAPSGAAAASGRAPFPLAPAFRFDARFPVEEVELVRSTLGRTGATHDTILRQRLGLEGEGRASSREVR